MKTKDNIEVHVGDFVWSCDSRFRVVKILKRKYHGFDCKLAYDEPVFSPEPDDKAKYDKLDHFYAREANALLSLASSYKKQAEHYELLASDTRKQEQEVINKLNKIDGYNPKNLI